MNETIVTVVGNVASELRVRRVGPDDDRVVGFRIAASERRWDRDTQSWVDGDRFSAWVSCWRRLAEGVVGSLVKGDPVVLTGRLSVREYDSGGERRFSTEIVASAVGPDLARSTASISRRRATATATSGDSASGDASGAGDAGVSSPTTGSITEEAAPDDIAALIDGVAPSAPSDDASHAGAVSGSVDR